jgi:hypothetical protein
MGIIYGLYLVITIVLLIIFIVKCFELDSVTDTIVYLIKDVKHSYRKIKDAIKNG